MKLLIDRPITIGDEGEGLLLQRTSRHTYVVKCKYLLIVSFFNGLLPQMNEVWNIDTSWIPGDNLPWSNEHYDHMVLPENIGKNHLRATFLGRVSAPTLDKPKPTRFDQTLTELLATAPRSDRPGGNRGPQAEALRKRKRAVRVGDLWLSEKAAEALSEKLGPSPRKGDRAKYLSKLILRDKERLQYVVD